MSGQSKPSVSGGAAGVAGFDPAGDDAVLPFEVGPLDVRGRIVHMSAQLDSILGRHDYPDPVSRLLAEALTITALLGASLKIKGQFLLQTQTDGPVSMLVVDFRTPGDLRAYASFDADSVADLLAASKVDAADLLGSGHLALTIDPGGTMNRYQGVVALDGQTLQEAAHGYFERSEQIPTRIRLAVAQTMTRGPDGTAVHGWRSGGIVLQFLPKSSDRTALRDLPPGDIPADAAAETAEPEMDDAWMEALALLETVEDHELTDPSIGVERLLFRLFHERGVRVFERQPVRDKCRCSKDRIKDMLARFDDTERREMIVDDEIVVTCEFCNSRYHFDPEASF